MDERSLRSQHPGSMRQAFLWALLPTLVLFLIAPSVGDAQVATNITSSGLNTQISQVGNSYNITEGTRPGCPGACGPNLFHSFGQFDVGRTAGVNDIANFVNLMNGVSYPTTNILARVTGTANNPSSIFGTIQTNGTNGFGAANLFLINPSGFVFGPNGSVNVGGSVSFSTAQYLRLSDGVDSANFYANPASDVLANSILVVDPVVNFGFLSSAAPAAYGFLTPPSPNATITVQGSTLSVPQAPADAPPNSISLVGGKVVIEGGAQLSAPNGRIHLATTASPGEFAALPGEPLANATSLQSVPNNPVDPASATSFTSYGLMSLAPGSSIDVHGTSTVWIKGGQLVLSLNDATLSTTKSPTPPGTTETISLSPGSTIVTSNSGTDKRADVQITVGNLQMDGSRVATLNTGVSDGGNISISATTVGLTNAAVIQSVTGIDLNTFTIVGSGNGGNVTVQGLPGAIDGAADSVTLSKGAGIVTASFGPGHGGDVLVSSRSLLLTAMQLDTGANLTSVTAGDGNGGSITANVDTLSLTNGAGINSNNFTFGLGQGGSITVQGPAGLGSATDVVTLDGSAQIITQTQSGPGGGGNVSITADRLVVGNTSSIESQTSSGTGTGGDLALNVGDLIVSGGSLVRILNDTHGIDSDLDGVVDSGSFGVGGNLTIQGTNNLPANSVVLSGGSQLGTQTSDGPGGNLTITASVLSLKESSSIFTSTDGFGRGGDINVNFHDASLGGGATITSRTFLFDLAAGTGGNITLKGLDGKKAESFTLSGLDSGIISDSFGLGGPGNIEVLTKTANLSDGAVIIGGTPLSTGTGGDVTIIADTVGISGGSRVASQAFALDAGKVTITANQLTLDNGSILTTAASPLGGSGGDVVVNVGSISLANSSTINSSTSATGRAGDIVIGADQSITVDSGSSIVANTTGQGNAGNVLMNADMVTVTNGSQISTSARPPVEFFGLPSDLTGTAGNISITTTGNSLVVSNGGTIASSSQTGGNAGTISITSPSLTLDNGIITTSASSTGNAGGIKADVGTLTLTNAAEIASSSTGTMSDAGDAGSVTIKDSGSFTSNGSKVSTSAENAKGGDILIDAQSVQLSNGTLISANSNAPLLLDGAGNAGNITINSDSNVVMQNSKVTTEATNASGGDITINANAAEMVQLVNSRVSTSVGGSVGVPGASDGGNITIDPQFVILQNSQIIAQANAGAGGAIKIVAGSAYIKDPASIVDASSTLGISGPVIIESPVKNVGGQLTPLSQQFSSAAALLAQRCAARVADGKFSTFVVAGREGLPVEPGGFLASPSWTAELLGATLSGLYPHTQFSAVTGAFPEYDVRPIQLAKYGDACRQ